MINWWRERERWKGKRKYRQGKTKIHLNLSK